jgi:hypothetical protein
VPARGKAYQGWPQAQVTEAERFVLTCHADWFRLASPPLAAHTSDVQLIVGVGYRVAIDISDRSHVDLVAFEGRGKSREPPAEKIAKVLSVYRQVFQARVEGEEKAEPRGGDHLLRRKPRTRRSSEPGVHASFAREHDSC